MIEVRLERARFLLLRKRYAEAEAELREVLAADPECVRALTRLALCRSARDAHEEATEIAERALALDPESPHPRVVLAQVLLARGSLPRALEEAERVLEIEPEEVLAHQIAATVHVREKDWHRALAAADRGLEVDPEDEDCRNLRALALNSLGRSAEAEATVVGALERDPESTWAHFHQGYTLLHRGDPRRALVHFRESLRLDPENDGARRGVRESLKAHHWLYRPLLSYELWMQRLRSRSQIAVIAGAWLVYRFVLGLARDGGALAPLWWSIVVLYLAGVLMTWIGSPIFDLLLFLHRDGRLALNRRERWASVLVPGTLLAGVLIVLGSIAADFETGALLGLCVAMFTVPLHLWLQLEERSARRRSLGYLAALVLCATGFLTAWQHQVSVGEALDRQAQETTPVPETGPQGGAAGGTTAALEQDRLGDAAYVRARRTTTLFAVLYGAGAVFGSQVVVAFLGHRSRRR